MVVPLHKTTAKSQVQPLCSAQTAIEQHRLTTPPPRVAVPFLAGNIPSAPVAYSQQKPQRQEGGRTRAIDGVGMRFTSLKAPKIIISVAPPERHPEPPAYPRLPFHSTVEMSYQPTMDIPWLRAHFIPAVRRTGDDKHADYLDLCHPHGFVTASSLPIDASRLLAPNKCIPGTPRG